MTQGMLRLGELLILFTVLTNDGSENVNGETIAFLKTAIHAENQASPSVRVASPVRADVIQITQRENDYLLTVPVSRLIMSIPRNGLSQQNNPAGGSTDHSRYFYFAGLSITSGLPSREARAKLDSLLRNIVVTEKK